MRHLREKADLGRANDTGRQTLADSVRVLGEDHTHTLTSRNNFAFAYHAAGRRGEAILLFEANLADRVRVLGGDHPDTLTSRNNLTGAHRAARQSGGDATGE